MYVLTGCGCCLFVKVLTLDPQSTRLIVSSTPAATGGDAATELLAGVVVRGQVDVPVYLLVLLRTAEGLPLGRTDANTALTYATVSSVTVSHVDLRPGEFELQLDSTVVRGPLTLSYIGLARRARV